MKHFALVSGLALLVLSAAGCYQASTTQSAVSSTAATTTTPPAAAPAAKPAAATANANEVELAGGLKYVDLKVGEGDIAEAGLMATVHYTGWLTDGTQSAVPVPDRRRQRDSRLGRGCEGHADRRQAPPDDPARHGIRREGLRPRDPAELHAGVRRRVAGPGPVARRAETGSAAGPEQTNP